VLGDLFAAMQPRQGERRPTSGAYESLQVPRFGYGPRDWSGGVVSQNGRRGTVARCPAPGSSQTLAEVGELRERGHSAVSAWADGRVRDEAARWSV